MNQHLNDVPIVCCLTSADLREREKTLLAQFKSAVTEIDELPAGYSFRIREDGKGIQIAAEMIEAERKCCPFMMFELVAPPGMAAVTVRVTGPAEAKEFVKTIFLR